MENAILDSLDDLGYEGPLLEESIFNSSIDEGPKSPEFTKIVEWISYELSSFYNLEHHVNAIAGAEDSETFLMELSGFLREYGCPYKALSEGPVLQRLDQKEKRLALLDYLLTELQATRMLAANKPYTFTTTQETPIAGESDEAKEMREMLISLGFPKPPAGITPFQLFSKLEAKIKEQVGSVHAAHMSKPLLKARLSDKQWESVAFINQALQQEYSVRRDMILKRLDVTIQSFKWSDKLKNHEDKLVAVYQPIRRQLSSTCNVDLAHLLAAREDLLNFEKASSGEAREKSKCEINRVLIGKVPDRGGRVFEMEPPPPEMPSFMKRQDHPQQQRSDRGGRGGHRGEHGGGRGGGGNRVQGGWSGGGGGGGGNQSRPQSAASGGEGGWGSNAPQYQQPSSNPGAAFYGGSGGYQAGGYTNPQGGGGYPQGGYEQQQGNQYHGGYDQGGYQQGFQQDAYNQPGYPSGGGFQNEFRDRARGGRGGRGRGRGGRRG